MADPVILPDDEEVVEDVAMEETLETEQEGADGEFSVVPEANDAPPRVAFIDYLRSPVVELVMGSGSSAIILSAHQDLLTKSPFFEQKCAEFTGNKRRIALPDEDLEAMGSFLEYLYNGEYFPKQEGGKLEFDPSIPYPDTDGTHLLKHARIYNLAKKFSVPALQTLAHNKIHRITSTARGEIAYARYVYANTSPDDSTVRKPIAAFWATRSHVLRHDAEEEFRAMCLEFPQFGFDVLSRVLDMKEKKVTGVVAGGDASVTVDSPATGRGRKRIRTSVPV